MNILITGATGFIGTALLEKMEKQQNVFVHATTRIPHKKNSIEKNIRWFTKKTIDAGTDWHNELKNIDVVIHLAARAHVSHKKNNEELELFKEINVRGTLRLATQAIEAGVKRFIFLSSIGVNGSETPEKQPFSEDSPINPDTYYAQSKFDAETELLRISKYNHMEVVIIRPPLVYSDVAPGNFRILLKMVSAGIPLPFKSLNNKKSFVSIRNLIDFIALCTSHPKAANQLFLISDDEDLSTEEILNYLAIGMCKKTRLFFIPSLFVKFIAGILKKDRAYIQLYSSLQINTKKAIKLLDWTPQEKATNALIEAGKQFSKRK